MRVAFEMREYFHCLSFEYSILYIQCSIVTVSTRFKWREKCRANGFLLSHVTIGGNKKLGISTTRFNVRNRFLNIGRP